MGDSQYNAQKFPKGRDLDRVYFNEQNTNSTVIYQGTVDVIEV